MTESVFSLEWRSFGLTFHFQLDHFQCESFRLGWKITLPQNNLLHDLPSSWGPQPTANLTEPANKIVRIIVSASDLNWLRLDHLQVHLHYKNGKYRCSNSFGLEFDLKQIEHSNMCMHTWSNHLHKMFSNILNLFWGTQRLCNWRPDGKSYPCVHFYLLSSNECIFNQPIKTRVHCCTHSNLVHI